MIKRWILRLLGLDSLAEDIATLSIRLRRAELEAARLQLCILTHSPHSAPDSQLAVVKRKLANLQAYVRYFPYDSNAVAHPVLLRLDRIETELAIRLTALERNVHNLRATLMLPTPESRL